MRVCKRRCQVAVDGIDVAAGNAGIFEGHADAALYADRIGRGHAAALALAAAVDGPADDFRINACAALLCAFEALQHENTRAGTRHKTGGTGTHRSRGFFRLIVARAVQDPHGVKAGPDVRRCSLSTTGEHAFRQAAADAQYRIDDRLGAGAAGTAVGGHLIAQCKQATNFCGDAAGHDLFNRRTAQAACLAGVGERHQLFSDRIQPADAGADDRAGIVIHRVRVRLRHLKTRITPGIDRCYTGIFDARIHGKKLLLGEVLLADFIDILRHARDVTAQFEFFHLRDETDAGFALAQGLLKCLETVAVRRNDAEAGDDYACFHVCLTPIPAIVPLHTVCPFSSLISALTFNFRRRK